MVLTLRVPRGVLKTGKLSTPATPALSQPSDRFRWDTVRILILGSTDEGKCRVGWYRTPGGKIPSTKESDVEAYKEKEEVGGGRVWVRSDTLEPFDVRTFRPGKIRNLRSLKDNLDAGDQGLPRTLPRRTKTTKSLPYSTKVIHPSGPTHPPPPSHLPSTYVSPPSPEPPRGHSGEGALKRGPT